MESEKSYKVLKAISFRSDRIEAGSVIHATDAEAENIGIGEYLQPVEAPVEDQGTDTNTGDSNDAGAGAGGNDAGDGSNTEAGAGSDTTGATEVGSGSGDDAKTIKHVVTQEDLDANPDLVTNGVNVGDEIDIPAPATDGDAGQTA